MLSPCCQGPAGCRVAEQHWNAVPAPKLADTNDDDDDDYYYYYNVITIIVFTSEIRINTLQLWQMLFTYNADDSIFYVIYYAV